MRRYVVCALAGVFLMAGCGAFVVAEPAPDKGDEPPRQLVERRIKHLGQLPRKVSSPQVLSPNGKRLAYSTGGSGVYVVVCDGKTSRPHNGGGYPIRSFRFSRDGAHYVYHAKHDGKELIVYDGKEGPEYDKASWAKFSPDGKHWIYGARRGDRHFIVIDGVERPGKLYKSRFAPDGRLAYAVRNGLVLSIVMDGKTVYTREAEHVGRIRFSADARHFFLSAHKNPRTNHYKQLIVDGKEHPLYGGTISNSVMLSPDGRRLAYVTWHEGEGKVTVVCDGKRTDGYRRISFLETAHTKTVFSPDSKHFVYWANLGDKQYMVMDGKAGNPHPIGCWPISPVFSRDGRHFAYVVRPPNEGFRMVLDGRTGPAYDRIEGAPVFSPDGQRLAYNVRTMFKNFVVCDGQEGPHFENVKRPVLSRDSKHLAYLGGDVGGRYHSSYWHLVCDGRAGPKDDAITISPFFSPDSRHVGYFGGRKEGECVVIDGVAGPPHSRLWTTQDWVGRRSSWVRWISAGDGKTTAKLRYVVHDQSARNGRYDVWLVEADVPADLGWTNGLKFVKP